jgi:hypothetical protein
MPPPEYLGLQVIKTDWRPGRDGATRVKVNLNPIRN